jgi:hypothetical protein
MEQSRTRRAPVQIVLFCAALMLGGMCVSVLFAWVLAYFRAETTRSLATLGAIENDQSRSVQISGNWMMRRAAVSGSSALSWAPQRAAGPPDTKQMGDIPSAWASDTPDGQAEWLEMDYAQPILAQRILIYETNAPGALVRISTADDKTQPIDLWRGSDPARPNADGIAVADIAISPSAPISRIRLHLDSVRVSGWNEIDAVELVGKDGTRQWASSATASSSFAR